MPELLVSTNYPNFNVFPRNLSFKSANTNNLVRVQGKHSELVRNFKMLTYISLTTLQILRLCSLIHHHSDYRSKSQQIDNFLKSLRGEKRNL
jgi:hypothetical protein